MTGNLAGVLQCVLFHKGDEKTTCPVETFLSNWIFYFPEIMSFIVCYNVLLLSGNYKTNMWYYFITVYDYTLNRVPSSIQYYV